MYNRTDKMNSCTLRTAKIKSFVKKCLHEKKMFSFHHPTTNPARNKELEL